MHADFPGDFISAETWGLPWGMLPIAELPLFPGITFNPFAKEAVKRYKPRRESLPRHVNDTV